MIAIVLGVPAIEHYHKRVRSLSTVELVNALEQEKAHGRSGQIANRLVRSMCEKQTSFDPRPPGRWSLLEPALHLGHGAGMTPAYTARPVTNAVNVAASWNSAIRSLIPVPSPAL